MTSMEKLKHMPWPIIRRQVFAVFRYELRTTAFSPGTVIMFILALMPTVFSVIALIFREPHEGMPRETNFAGFVYFYVARFIVFFGCAFLFGNMFRKHLLDKTLHYYFLTPVRREVLTIGKFLGRLLVFSFMQMLAVTSFFIVYHLGNGTPMQRFYSEGSGTRFLLTYVLIVFCAVLGYGAVFTLFGVISRNATRSIMCFFAWETINIFLPPGPRHISVAYYINSMLPVQPPPSPFSLSTENASFLLSFLCLLIFTLAVLGFAAWRSRRIEASYASD